VYERNLHCPSRRPPKSLPLILGETGVRLLHLYPDESNGISGDYRVYKGVAAVAGGSTKISKKKKKE
jgi:hypothetical protein